MVFLIGKYAFKVPQLSSTWKMFLLGLVCNMQENQFGRMRDERMCPVIFSLPGGWLTVMPRCEALERHDYYRFINTDIDIFFEGDFRVPVENKLDSFGWYKGKIVAIDYGS